MMRREKYNRKRVRAADGYWYDSIAEKDYAEILLALEKSGAISNIRRQEMIKLSAANIGYKPDFSYTEAGRRIYVDVKGFETPEFRLKARLWRAYGPGPLRIVKRGKNGGFVTVKEIMPLYKHKLKMMETNHVK